MICKEYVECDDILIARVKFSLPDSMWADRVYLVGDFNSWNRTSHPMQRQRSGRWTISLDLEIGHAYQFRYLQDNNAWLNDTQADAFVCNPYGTDNFVVVTDPVFQRCSDTDSPLGQEERE